MISFLPVVLITNMAIGQVAIIQDEDGFTNVRAEPNGQAAVIHRIYDNEVFWYDNEVFWDDEEINKYQDWVSVYVPKSKYSLGCSQQALIIGFIHKSRLRPILQMPAYQGGGFQFDYSITAFDSRDRIIDRHEGQWITAIDGRHVWGTDGGLPTTQISNVDAIVEGQRININEAFYIDLFECNSGFFIRKNGDTYFVYQENSDGAGFYEIVWVLTRDGLKQRLVGSIL